MLQKVSVPEGVYGNWKVKRRHVFPSGVDYTPEGDYTFLLKDSEIIMSDTPDRMEERVDVVDRAVGKCLIAGLGLGMVLDAMCRNDKVDHITVIEKASPVIQLVAPHYINKYGDKIEIILDDISDWKPSQREKFDVVWFDIWNTVCANNFLQRTGLCRKYKQRALWCGACMKQQVKSRYRTSYLI